MKTIIQGKKLKTTYGIDGKCKAIGEDKTVYTAKPELTKKTEVVDWKTICEFDENIEFNHSVKTYYTSLFAEIGKINLSENEEVSVLSKTFRADLGAYVLRVDKILNEEILYKEESEAVLETQIREFNKQMIESNEKLLAYCKVNKLNSEETDVDALFKIVFPDREYNIVDGKLVVKDAIALGTIRNNQLFDLRSDLFSTANAISSMIRGE